MTTHVCQLRASNSAQLELWTSKRFGAAIRAAGQSERSQDDRYHVHESKKNREKIVDKSHKLCHDVLV